MLLNKKLNFMQHAGNAIMKVNKDISFIKKLKYSLLQKSLATI